MKSTSRSPEEVVLAVTIPGDEHADAVELELGRRGARLLRIDFGAFPTRHLALSPQPRNNAFVVDGEPVPDCSAVWYRRITPPRPRAGLDSGEARWVTRETTSALRAGIRLLPTRRWVNDPDATEYWELKLVQVAHAAKHGITVPATLATNSPRAARDFAAAHERVVVKAVHQAYIPLTSGPRAAYTVPFEPTADLLDAVALSPVILQQQVAKRADIRATYVEGRLFVARLPAAPHAPVDWRQSRTDGWESCTLPVDLSRQLSRMVAATGLLFAAIDLIESVDGGYVFLEMNPAGQWLWLDDELQLGITSAVADLLLRESSQAKVRWPGPWKQVGYDFLPASLVPSNDGLEMPHLIPPLILDTIPDNQLEQVCDGLARQVEANEGRAKIAEEKSARLLSFTLFLLPAGLGGVAFFLQHASAQQTLGWCGAGFSMLASAFSVLSMVDALAVDRVGLYRCEDIRLDASDPGELSRVRMRSLWCGSDLARRTADRKLTVLMYARAWTTRAGVCMLLAAIIATVLLASSTTAYDHASRPPMTQSDLAP